MTALISALGFAGLEGAPPPTPARVDRGLDATPPSPQTLLPPLSSFAACQALPTGLARPKHCPQLRLQFSCSLSPLCELGGFYYILGFAFLLISPFTRMSHGGGSYLFQKKIAEGISVLWSGACHGEPEEASGRDFHSRKD